MDSLHSFIDEMLLDSDTKKDIFLEALLKDIKQQPIPTLKQAQSGFTVSSHLHGIRMNYESHEVTIVYKVVPDLYEDYIVNFAQFAVIVEGLITCRRKQRWALES